MGMIPVIPMTANGIDGNYGNDANHVTGIPAVKERRQPVIAHGLAGMQLAGGSERAKTVVLRSVS
jgi:hypothetical protein